MYLLCELQTVIVFALQVKYLENKLKSKQASHCKDESGRLHHHGTRWKKGLCTTCICKVSRCINASLCETVNAICLWLLFLVGKMWSLLNH